MADVGYIRVSTVDQNEARQLDGVKLDKVFREQASGDSRERPQLALCLDYVREGDTLHIHSIDRLARNLRDLVSLMEDLTAQGVAVRFHAEQLIFTGGDAPAQRLMLHVIGACAEFERQMIRQRQREGIEKARREGRPMGRPQKLSPDTQRTIAARLADGESTTALAREYSVSLPLIHRIRRRYNKDGS